MAGFLGGYVVVDGGCTACYNEHKCLNTLPRAGRQHCAIECHPSEEELAGMHQNCLACSSCVEEGKCETNLTLAPHLNFYTPCCQSGKLGRCSKSYKCETDESSPSCDEAQFPGFFYESAAIKNLTAAEQDWLSAAGGGQHRGALGVVAVLMLVALLS